MRYLRGTAADPFGYTQVRRTERRLAAGYEAELRDLLAGLSAATLPAAVELARLPLDIRGYEQIKLAAVERYERELERLRPLARRPGTYLPPGLPGPEDEKAEDLAWP
jgi:indolepyruvate ferredoxin oxidoreductase